MKTMLVVVVVVMVYKFMIFHVYKTFVFLDVFLK